MRSRWGRGLAAGAEIGWWWAAAVATWALTLSSVPPRELIAAAICGLPCAVAARAGRKAVGGYWRPRRRWTAWLLPLMVAVPADTARMLAGTIRWFVARQVPGELQELQVPAGEPPDVAAARHAMAILTMSATPGTFVVGCWRPGHESPGAGTAVGRHRRRGADVPGCADAAPGVQPAALPHADDLDRRAADRAGAGDRQRTRPRCRAA